MSLGRRSPASVPASPITTAADRRRLSSRRRGSISAPDPWGTYEETTDRGVASVLHILKAPAPSPDDLDEKATRRRSANAHLVRTQSGGSNRISFAASGFRPPSPHSDSGSQQPSHSRRSSTYNATSRHSLTPAQVLELAQQCNHPVDRPTSPGGLVQRAASPVHFTPIPDEQLLPFVDRPAEVHDLITSPASPARKLFMLLAQTFPKNAAPGKADNPKTWTYAQLEAWLTQTPRETAPDAEWVAQARLCIANKSELIWERVKAALGVPPELEDSGVDIIGPGMPEGKEAEAIDFESEEEDVWIEPIIAQPTPLPSPFAPGGSGASPTVERHSLELIREDEPDPATLPPKSPPSPLGLRIINAPSPPPARRFSTPTHSRGSSFSHLHDHYDALSERGPGHPLFPSNFRHVNLGPTLRAGARSPPMAAPSRFGLPLPAGGAARKGSRRSWAEGWDPLRQEYAVSIGSASSVGKA